MRLRFYPLLLGALAIACLPVNVGIHEENFDVSGNCAYASDAEDWAGLNGWLASINGDIQLIYGEVQLFNDGDSWSGQQLGNIVDQLDEIIATISDFKVSIDLGEFPGNVVDKLNYIVQSHEWIDGVLWSGVNKGGINWDENSIYGKIVAMKTSLDQLSDIKSYLQACAAAVTDIRSFIYDEVYDWFLDIKNLSRYILVNDEYDNWTLQRVNTLLTTLGNIYDKLGDISELLSGQESQVLGEVSIKNWPQSPYHVVIDNLPTYSNGELKVHDYGVFNQLTDIKSSLLEIISILRTPDVGDIVGEFDFDGLKQNADGIVDRLSTLAPFGAFALIAAMLAIWTGFYQITDPSFEIPFGFAGETGNIQIDLSWLADLQPVIDFFMISLLVWCLANASIRVIEYEATS